jgi:F-box-like
VRLIVSIIKISVTLIFNFVFLILRWINQKALAMELTVNSLSPETLVQIFSYLEREEDLSNVRGTCKAWDCIAKDMILWREFYRRSGVPHLISRVDSNTGYLVAAAFYRGMRRLRESVGKSIAWNALVCPEEFREISEYRWARLPQGQEMLVGSVSRAGTGGSAICCWSLPDGELIKRSSLNAGVKLRQLHIISDEEGELLLAAAGPNSIYIWKLESLEEPRQIDVGGWFGHLISAQVDGKWRLITSPTENRKVCLWDPINGERLEEVPIGGVDGDVIAGEVDGHCCLFASDDTGEVCIWDLDQECVVATLPGVAEACLSRLVWLPNCSGGGHVALHLCGMGQVKITDIQNNVTITSRLSDYLDYPSWVRAEGEGRFSLITANRYQYFVDMDGEIKKAPSWPKNLLLDCNSSKRCGLTCDPQRPYESFRWSLGEVPAIKAQDINGALSVKAAAQLLTPGGLLLVKKCPTSEGERLFIVNMSEVSEFEIEKPNVIVNAQPSSPPPIQPSSRRKVALVAAGVVAVSLATTALIRLFARLRTRSAPDL